MVAIKKVNNIVRWREKWRTKRQLIRLNKIIDTGKLLDNDMDNEPSLNKKFELVLERDGLRTWLVPINRPQAPKASTNVENFLKDIERSLLSIVQKNLKDLEEIENKISKDVKIFLDKLSKSSKVCIPTNKSNKHVLVELDDYKSMMNQHLSKDAIEIPSSKVVDLYEASKELLDDIEL